jgi:hypothetical protein
VSRAGGCVTDQSTKGAFVADASKPISGIPQLDAYLRTRLTDDQQEAVRQTYADGDPEGTQAVVNQAMIKNDRDNKKKP